MADIDSDLKPVLTARRTRGKLTRGPSGRQNSKSLALNRAPLSSGQERLWFLEQFSPDSRAYNRPAHIRFTGQLDIGSLEQTLNHIVNRHEVLRTHFSSTDDGPAQVVRSSISLAFPVIDLSNLNPDIREKEAMRLAVEETLEPFDLTSGPLLRTKLLRLDLQQHILLLTFHHIVFDGWSQSILYREISALYQAYSQDDAPELPSLPIQYGDFAVWQRQRLETQDLEKANDYWRRRLKDCPDILALPTDRPRPRIQTYSGASYALVLTDELSNQLKQLSRQQGSTLFITLLTAFFTLLHRYSGQTDIAIGFPVAGRLHMELENLIGFFINTLVLRADVSGSPTLGALLNRVQKLAIEAYEHQELSFEKLVDELDVERDLSRSPLFQVFFQLRNYPKQVLKLAGLQGQRFDVDCSVEKFDLFVDAIEEETGRLICLFRYNVDLFDSKTIVQLASHFRRVLEAMVANLDCSVSDLDLLSQAERKQLLIDWNDTYCQPQSDDFIQLLFEHQAERLADKTALGFENQTVTYRRLNERANQLAHYIVELGAESETLIGLFMNPSPQKIVALLAILKAGAAFVPLDPGLPKERLKLMLDGVKILITKTELLELLPDHSSQVVDLDLNPLPFRNASRENLAPIGDPENLAYVIYTSGSTGKPKGVMIEHQSFVNLLNAMGSQLRFSQDDVVLSITNLSFDIGVLEVLLPLSTGAQLLLVSREIATDARPLMKELSHSEATVMMGTPATWRMLVDSGWRGKTGLKMVNGGEALSFELATQLLARGEVLWNMYGPTETTVYSTGAQIRSDHDTVTIGRPISNTQCYVLDASNQPVPVGVPGQLYIGGLGLARGYWKRPDLTASSFIVNPFTYLPSKRLYASGDLVRWRHWGEIEFLGRLDHQLKIRGFRVEPGEIEQILSQHPVVRECLVIAREDTPGDARLIAYIVPRRNSIVSDISPSGIPWDKWQSEQVSQWESVWSQTFSSPPESSDPTCNTAGVVSSYTGFPIPADEARDWVNHAARRVLDLKPDKVLDIGCGLGRTLFRVAPHCSTYWGLDFSQPALDYIKRHLSLLDSKPIASKHTDIRLIRASADQLEKIASDKFDVVIINGVVMYFPSMHYLVEVVGKALQVTLPGGRIFIGDVRSLPLLEAFHLSVGLENAEAEESLNHLWRRVQRQTIEEEELVVDPRFFMTLKQHFPTINDTKILLKRGWAFNELTRFRYDVILDVNGTTSSQGKINWLDWKKDGLSIDGIHRHLMQTEPETLGVRRVPNSRVLPEVNALRDLGRETGGKTVEILRTELEQARGEAIHPEEFWRLSEELPYSVDITWSAGGDSGHFDVSFYRRSNRTKGANQHSGEEVTDQPVSDWAPNDYGNNPLAAKMNRSLTPVLRSLAEQKLPNYMIPSGFIFLNEMPLTSNGKLDRKALPVPQVYRSTEESSLSRSPLEEVIAEVWSEVLQLEQIGVRDNFFELGGHSLSAIQVVNRLRFKLTAEVPLVLFFEVPTVEQLAERLESDGVDIR